MVEQEAVNFEVAGSSPASRARPSREKYRPSSMTYNNFSLWSFKKDLYRKQDTNVGTVRKGGSSLLTSVTLVRTQSLLS